MFDIDIDIDMLLIILPLILPLILTLLLTLLLINDIYQLINRFDWIKVDIDIAIDIDIRKIEKANMEKMKRQYKEIICLFDKLIYLIKVWYL